MWSYFSVGNLIRHIWLIKWYTSLDNLVYVLLLPMIYQYCVARVKMVATFLTLGNSVCEFVFSYSFHFCFNLALLVYLDHDSLLGSTNSVYLFVIFNLQIHVVKRGFNKRWSTTTPISIKHTTTSHLKPSNSN